MSWAVHPGAAGGVIGRLLVSRCPYAGPGNGFAIATSFWGFAAVGAGHLYPGGCRNAGCGPVMFVV